MFTTRWPFRAVPRERQPLAPIPAPPPLAQQIHVPSPEPPPADDERTIKAPGVTADLA